MSIHSRRRGQRLSGVLAAVTAAVLLITTPLMGGIAASAAPTGYVGTGDSQPFDDNNGDRVLPIMTAGEAYSETLTGPQYYPTDWCWSVEDGALPVGISMTTPEGGCAPSATFSGTPGAGYFAFALRIADTAGETVYRLSFEGTIESGKSPTTTTLTAPEVASNDSIQLSATVAGNPVVSGPPTGSVEFRDHNDMVIATGTLSAGTTTATASIDRSRVGVDLEVTAVYLGDDDYQGSSSTGFDLVVYAATVTGTVVWNGTPATGATVRLLSSVDGAVIDSDTTDSLGAFVLTPATITTVADAERTYVVEVTFADDEVLYYVFEDYNVTDLDDADRTGALDWTGSLVVERQTGPRWEDDGLRTPRVGSVYSDTVSASGRGTITFTVTAGNLPSGLSLDSATGAVTGTPDECSSPQTPFPFFARGLASCDYDFTITIDNGYGDSDERFTGTLLPAGVAPTWEDENLGELREGVAVDEAVLADGDPTIVYTVTDGTLPAGLTLSASGVLTGTPTTAGPFVFTITAQNDYGSITTVFEGEVGAKPELDLELEFEAGTSIEDAASTISAEGLEVGSTYTLTMFSTPRVLYTGTVGPSGSFTWVVSLPADTPPGSHRLVLTGIAASGAPMSAQAWFRLGTNGRILATSYAGPIAGGGLAATGVEVGGNVLAAAAMLVLGAGALTVSRRRRAV